MPQCVATVSGKVNIGSEVLTFFLGFNMNFLGVVRRGLVFSKCCSLKTGTKLVQLVRELSFSMCMSNMEPQILRLWVALHACRAFCKWLSLVTSAEGAAPWSSSSACEGAADMPGRISWPGCQSLSRDGEMWVREIPDVIRMFLHCDLKC